MSETLSPIDHETFPYHSRVVLHIFRHGKKLSAQEGQADETIVLNQLGREQGQAKGEAVQPQKDVAMAIGSPRIRSQETAARAMLHDEVTPDMDFAALQEKVTSSFGKKMVADPRLNFESVIGTPMSDISEKRYADGYYLEYLLKESDNLAIQNHDTQNSTITRIAANIADLIKKYVQISDNFERLITNQSEKYAQFKNQMERYMGTHQGVTESFLAKLLEKLGKQDEIDSFIEKSPAGFAETQGISLEITHGNGGDKTITLNYELADGPKSVEITEGMLDEIIQDGREFEEKIKNG